MHYHYGEHSTVIAKFLLREFLQMNKCGKFTYSEIFNPQPYLYIISQHYSPSWKTWSSIYRWLFQDKQVHNPPIALIIFSIYMYIHVRTCTLTTVLTSTLQYGFYTPVHLVGLGKMPPVGGYQYPMQNKRCNKITALKQCYNYTYSQAPMVATNMSGH